MPPPLPVSINYLAVLVVAVVSMVLGFLWYGFIFNKTWVELSFGKDKKKLEEMKKKGMKSYPIAFLAVLVTMYVFAYGIDFVQAVSVVDGMMAGFWIWLGFVAPLMLGMVLWDGKPFKLYLINVTYQLVTLVVAGAILAVWT